MGQITPSLACTTYICAPSDIIAIRQLCLQKENRLMTSLEHGGRGWWVTGIYLHWVIVHNISVHVNSIVYVCVHCIVSEHMLYCISVYITLYQCIHNIVSVYTLYSIRAYVVLYQCVHCIVTVYSLSCIRVHTLYCISICIILHQHIHCIVPPDTSTHQSYFTGPTVIQTTWFTAVSK